MNTRRLSLLLLPLALLMAGPSVASAQSKALSGPAQQVTGSGVRQTLDCGGNAVSISGSSNVVTLQGTCSRVDLTGSDNRVTLAGRATRLEVHGSSNVVRAATVGRILIEGADNAVTWHRAITGTRPVTSVTGSSNTVSKR
ncbi:DUF3060 domain-containing protein [Deinococcus sp. UYEF24]